MLQRVPEQKRHNFEDHPERLAEERERNSMPLLSASHLPEPTNWQDLETLWCRSLAQRMGRR